MSNMRALTQKENKLFLYYLLGYLGGLKHVPANQVGSKRPISFEKHIPIAYKEDIKWYKRRKDRYNEYHHGFIDGYFKSITSEKPICQMDPFRNPDIQKYLESMWLHNKVYGVTETQTK